jgi:hypothetical protein
MSWTRRDDVTVVLLSRIWEVFGSDLGRVMTRIFVVFLSPSREMPEKRLDYVTAGSFPNSFKITIHLSSILDHVDSSVLRNFIELLSNFTNFMDCQTVCYERQSNLHVA